MSLPLQPPPAFPGAKSPFVPEKGFPDWPGILGRWGCDWTKVVAAARGKRVLVGSNTGMHGAVTTLDSILAVALTVRGAQVARMFCDGVLQGCLIPVYGEATPVDMIADRGLVSRLCKACFSRGTNTHRPLGLPEYRFSSLLRPQDYPRAQELAASVPFAEIQSWEMDGLPVGEHAYAGALRYFATGDLADQERAEDILRRYLEGAILTAFVYDRMIDEFQPEIAVLHHGIYSPQGVAAAVCRRRGVRVVTWVVAYRKNCFIFSHDDTYHHTLMDEPTTEWEDVALTETQRQAVESYLSSRATGGRDWIYFHKDPEVSFDTFAQARAIDARKPIVAVLTNVMWDAQLHYPANAFPGMREWVLETIDYFRKRTDLEVVIRVHPAEVRGAVKSRQRVADEVNKVFGSLPPHIHIVGPDEEASTYAIAAAADTVVIYGTKMGTELAPTGKPIIVAGEAWIKNKGLTQDARDKAHYFALLDQLPVGDGGKWRPDRDRALLYAYHFFFRRMIPLPFLEPNGTGAMFDLKLGKLDDLDPGRYPGLDTIMDGILLGRPFTYKAERYGIHDVGTERRKSVDLIIGEKTNF